MLFLLPLLMKNIDLFDPIFEASIVYRNLTNTLHKQIIMNRSLKNVHFTNLLIISVLILIE
jgi:hypothetical protein